MTHVIGWIIVGLVSASLAVNATYMMISPRAWFRLPSWIRATGTLRERESVTGWGAVMVRLAGVLILGGLGWVILAII